RKLGVVVALAVTLAACAGGSPSPQAVVSRAPARTVAARSSKVSVRVTTTGVTGVAAGVTITGEGAFDYGGGKGTLALDLPAIAGVNIGRIDAVYTQGVIFEKLPAPFAAQLSDKPW